MSIIGIDKVKTTVKINIGVSKHGMTNNFPVATKNIYVNNDLTNPSSGSSNLNFAYLHVNDSNINSFNNKSEVRNYTSSTLNVKSNNSEYSLTLDLDNIESVKVSTFYQNTGVRVNIKLSDDDVWT